MRNILNTILVLLLILSCRRQELEDYCYAKVLIPVTIEWSGAALDIDNDVDNDLYSASVWLFPTSNSEYNGEPLEFRFTDAQGGVIAAPIGTYNILIFNKTVSDFSSGIEFRGIDRYETFECYSNMEGSIINPDILAVYSLENYAVTADMLCEPHIIYDAVASRDSSNLSVKLRELMGVMPKRLTHALRVTFNVANLHSAESAQTKFYGMGESVNLSSGEIGESSNGHIIALEKGATKSNAEALEGYTNLFGPLEGAEYRLETQFNLIKEHNGSTTYPSEAMQHSVTDQIEATVLDSTRTYHVKIGFNKDSIVLPELSVGSGMEFDITDWEDDIVIPIE